MHGTLSGVVRKATVPSEQMCKFGRIVLAIWPNDPTANLAKAIKSTKRHASYIMHGERKVTARCIQAVVNEILN
jgi:hypothetical protein